MKSIKQIGIKLFIIIMLCSFYQHNKPFIDIKKNEEYKGKELDKLYIINYNNKPASKPRQFAIIKANKKIYDYYMANFVLVEIVDTSKYIFFPYGWESEKITTADIKHNCNSIVEGGISPINF